MPNCLKILSSSLWLRPNNEIFMFPFSLYCATMAIKNSRLKMVSNFVKLHYLRLYYISSFVRNFSVICDMSMYFYNIRRGKSCSTVFSAFFQWPLENLQKRLVITGQRRVKNVKVSILFCVIVSWMKEQDMGVWFRDFDCFPLDLRRLRWTRYNQVYLQ